MYQDLFSHPPFVHIVYFFAISSNATTDIIVRIYLLSHARISLRWIPRSETALSTAVQVLDFDRY